MSSKIISTILNSPLWDDMCESFSIVASPYSALTLYHHGNGIWPEGGASHQAPIPTKASVGCPAPHLQLPVRHLPGTLQTQDHRNDFHSSSWGSFTGEHITSANLLSTENQSSSLTPATEPPQFQVLNGSDCPFFAVTAVIILVETLLPVWIIAGAFWGASLPPGLLPSCTSKTFYRANFPQTELKMPFSTPNTRMVPWNPGMKSEFFSPLISPLRI